MAAQATGLNSREAHAAPAGDTADAACRSGRASIDMDQTRDGGAERRSECKRGRRLAHDAGHTDAGGGSTRSGKRTLGCAIHGSWWGLETGGCIQKGSAHCRWGTIPIYPCLLSLVLLSLPSATPEVQYYPTQIAVVAAPFLATGNVLGGIPFGPTTVELKDADYQRTSINDGNFLTVSLISGGVSELTGGKPILRFGLDPTAMDGIGNFTSLTIDKICTACRLRFVYKSLQVYSDVFDVIPSPPYEIVPVYFPTDGVAAVDIEPGPQIRVVDKGGNAISSVFEALVYRVSGFGLLRQRQTSGQKITTQSSGDGSNTATFSGLFVDTSSDKISYALGFNATFPGGIVINSVQPGLVVTGKIKDGMFQSGFLQLPNQTASLPLTTQPVITLKDWTETQVKTLGAQIEVTATLLNAVATGATLEGTTIITSVGGIATYTNLAIGKAGHNYVIRFSFISCDSNLDCASRTFFCSRLLDFCAGTYTTYFLDSSSFSINLGLASTISIAVQPADTLAGVPMSPAPVIHILDLGGNRVETAATVVASLEANAKGAALLSSAEELLISAVKGIATFPALSFDKTGSGFRLLFSSTNTAGQPLQSYSNLFAIAPATIKSINVAVQPGSALRGSLLSIQPRVTVLDRFENLAIEDAFVKTVTAELIGFGQVGTLGGQVVQSLVGGFASFTDLSVNNPAAQYVIQFSANGTYTSLRPKEGGGRKVINPPLLADSQSFVVMGLVSGLQIQQQPALAYGGSAFLTQPRVALVDLNQQIVASATRTVRVTISSGPDGAVLRPIPALKAAEFGIVQFTDLSINLAAPGYVIHFEVLGLSQPVIILSHTFSVVIGEPHSLVILAQPTDAIAAISMEPTPSVKVVDIGGNTIPYTSTIDVEALYGPLIDRYSVTAVQGVALFTQAINPAGTDYRLRFLIGLGNNTIQVISNSFVVSRGIAAVLDILVQPGHAIVNEPLTRMPLIVVKDAGFNALLDFNYPIYVTRAEGPSASYPEGNLSTIPKNAEARFNGLSISGTARAYTLRFTTTEPTLSGPRTITAESEAFVVTWEPQVLKVQNAPGPRDNAQIGGEAFTFHPSIAFQDKENQVVKARSSIISVSLAAADGLSGNLDLPAFEGISVFTDLSINRFSFPSFHSIGVSAGGLTTSLKIQVKKGVAASLFVYRPPTDAMSNKVFFSSVVLQFLDLGGNIVTGPSAQAPVTVALDANKFGGTLEGTLTVTPVDGEINFNDLKITGIGNGYTLLFASESFRVESEVFGVHGDATSMAIISFPAGAVIYTGTLDGGIPLPYMDPIRIALVDDAKNIITGGKYREPFAEISVALQYTNAWDTVNLLIPQTNLQLETNLGTTTAIVENGYALFDRVLLLSSTSVTSLQGIMLKFTSNVTSDTLLSPFFSTSLSEASLNLHRQMTGAQSSGLTLDPMPVVHILTGAGPIVRGSTLPVSVSIVGGSGAVLAGTTLVNASAGVYVFTDLSIQKASDPGVYYTLQFRVPEIYRNALLYTGLTRLSTPFTVSVGSPHSINLKSDLVPSTSGIPFASQPCVALRDAGSNLVRIVGAVTASLIASGGDQAMRIGTYITHSHEGLASFTNLGITKLTHGVSYQILFTSELLQTRSAVFRGLSGPPFKIEIVNISRTSKGGSPLEPAPRMRVTDAGDTEVAGPVEMTTVFESNPNSLGVLSNNIAIVRNGTVTFTQISISKASADYVLRFQSASASVVFPKFDVVVGPAKRVFVDAQPGTNVFGVNIVPAPRVVVLDAGDNWVTSSSTEIHARLILPAILGPKLRAGTKMQGKIARNAIDGVAVFDDLTVDNAGSGFRIEFSSIGLEIFVTTHFDVSGPPAIMTVDLNPTWVASGTKVSGDIPFQYQPIVKVRDFDGSVVTYYDVAHGVTASVSAGQQLSGNAVADIVGGSAIFTDLQLSKATDVAYLMFSYGGPMLTTSALSPVIDVKAGAPRFLDLLVQPSSASRGQKLGLQPQVQVRDAFHNTVKWYTGTLLARLRLGELNKDQHIRGTSSISFAESTGIATFTDLNVVVEEQALYIRFQTGGIRVDSEPFNIKQGPPFAMVLGSPPVGGVSTVESGLLQPQPIINIVDNGFGVVRSFSGAGRCATDDCDVSVTLICCPVNYLGAYAGAGALSGRTQVVAVNGQAFFTDLVINAPGDYTLRFAVAAIAGISGEIFFDLTSIPIQDFTSIAILNEPGQALLGMPMRGQPRIQITDSSNQKVNASYHVVNVSLTEDVGCVGLQGRTTIVAEQGLVQFTDLFLSTFSGAPTCRFNFSTNNPPMYALSEFFAMTYGPSVLLLPTEPAGAQAGQTLTTQPSLEFRDKGNFLLVSESGQTVSAELLQGDYDTLCGDVVCQDLLKGRTSILNSNGISTFTNLQVDKIHGPGYILLFRMGKYTMYSQKITVSQGAATSLLVITQPSDCQVTISMPSAPSIELLDAGFNRALSNASVTARIYPTSFTGISISGDVMAAINGLATFTNMTLKGDAALGISLEFMSGGLSIVSSIFLAHRPAKTLILQNPMPSFLTAGETFLPEQQVGLRDDFDFPAIADSSSAINVSLINKDTAAETRLPDVKVVSGGLAAFQQLKVYVKGDRFVFRYYLAADPSIYAESNYFSVVASTPKHIVVVQQPEQSIAAAVLLPSPSVYMEDVFNNRNAPSPGFHVNVCIEKEGQCSDIASVEGSRTLPLDAEIVTFSNIAVHGPHASGYKLFFYIDLPGMNEKVSVVSNPFDVRIGTPKLVMEQEPKYAQEGEIFRAQPRVAIADGAGNRFSGSSGGFNYLRVTASLSRTSVDDAKLSDELRDCPCTARLIDGVVTFGALKINRAGRAFQIDFSMADINVASVISAEVHVAGAVVYTETVGLPATIAYATPMNLTVALKDANSLAVVGQTLTVNVVNETGFAVHDILEGITTISAMTGVGVFKGLRFKDIGGPYRLAFNVSGFVDHSSPFTVIAREGTNIVLLDLPTRILAGTPITPVPTLQVRDEFDSVSGFTGGLTVTVLDGMNLSLQPPIVVTGAAGLANLADLRIATTSTGQGFRLRVEATLLGQTRTEYSDLFHVDAGALVALSCIVQPSDGITGEVLARQPTVHAVDAGGNLLAYFERQITVRLNDTDSSLDLVGTNILLAQNGIAIFTDLVINKPAHRHNFLISTSESCGVVSKSDKFTVTRPVSHILLTVVPPHPSGGTLLTPQPEVTLFDHTLAPVAAAVQSVTISLCVKPVGSLATLHGTTTLPAVKGIVRFTDVSIDLKGTYSVCYTAGNDVVNQTLDVIRGTPRYVTMLKQPTVITAGEPWTALISSGRNPVFRVTDAGGNPFVSDSGSGLPVDHVQIEVLDSGIRGKAQGLMCGGNGACFPRVGPCYDPTPFDGVNKFNSDVTPNCKIQNPGRNMLLKISILADNVLMDSVTSAPFDVVTGRCKSLKVMLHPSGVIVGQVFRRPPIVEMRDEGGNTIPWVRNTIKVQLSGSTADQATLSGCREPNGDTPNTNVDGTATFFGCVINCEPDASIGCLGPDLFRLKFGMTSCDGISLSFDDTSYFTNFFTVSSPPNQIRVKPGTVPVTMVSGHMATQPRVEYWVKPCNTIASSECFVETSDSGLTMTAEIYGAPNGATLKGTTTAQVVNGVAQFTDLGVNEASVLLTPSTYNISFHALGYPKTWQLMTVIVGIASSLRIKQQPTLTAPGDPFNAQVSLIDAGGNEVTSAGEALYITMALDSSFSVRTGVTLKTSAASLSVQTSSGVASWSGLTVNKAPVIYSFTFTAESASGTYLEVKSARISVVIGGVSEVQVLSHPQDTLAGVALSSIVAQLYDAGGNKIRTSEALLVSIVGYRGGGTLTGSTNTTITSEGVATFTGVSMTYASGESQHVLKISHGSIFRISNPFWVNLVASKIVQSTQPSQWGFAGKFLSEQPVIELRDAQENRAYSVSAGVVSVALVESGATLQGNTQAAIQKGLASFTDLSISVTGSYTLSFTHAAFTAEVSPAIEIRAGAVAALQVVSSYQPGINGTNEAGYSLPLQPRVRVLDTGGNTPNPVPTGNVVARIAEYPAGTNTTTINVLLGTTIAVPDPVTGIAKFTNLAINAVGDFRLVFVLGTFTVVSSPLVIVHGPIAQIIFNPEPSPTFFGEVLFRKPVIHLMDRGSNPVRGTPWIHVTLGKGRKLDESDTTGSTLTGCDKAYALQDTGIVEMAGCVVTGTTSGEHTLLVSTLLSGKDVLDSGFTFEPTMDSRLVHESLPFTVSLPTNQLNLKIAASGSIATNSFQVQPVVHALDRQSTLIQLRGAHIAVSLGHTNDTLLLGNKQAPLTGGMALFTDLRIDASGSYVLNFSLSVANIAYSVQQSIVVAPSLPDKLLAHYWPTAVVSGQSIVSASGQIPRIVIKDSVDNHILNAVEISVTSNCTDKATACLQGTLTTTASSGVSEFSNLVLNSAGNVTLMFSHETLRIAFHIEVTAGVAARIKILQQPPTSFLVGASITPALHIQLEDAYGNIAVDNNHSSASVAINSSPIFGALLSGDLSSTFVKSVAVFAGSISLSHSGFGYRLVFTSGLLQTISDAFAVHTAPTQMKFAAFPSHGEGGAYLLPQPQIKLYDATGTPVLNPSFVVVAKIDARTAALTGNSAVVTSGGVAQFTDLRLDRMGAHTLRFEYNNGVKMITLLSSVLTLVPGAPHSISIEEQPGGFVAGGYAFPIQPQIFLRDAGGNLANTPRAVTVSIKTPTTATLGGDSEVTSGGTHGAPLAIYSQGALTFTDLSIDIVGTHILTFASPGLVSAHAAAFTIVVGSAAKIGIITQPRDVNVGSPFVVQPIVQIQDLGGNHVEELDWVVTATINMHSVRTEILSTLELRGMPVMTSVLGWCNYTKLQIDVAGLFCDIRFSSPGLLPVTTETFTIRAVSPASSCLSDITYLSDCGSAVTKSQILRVEVQPSNVVNGRYLSPVPIIRLRDKDGIILTEDGSIFASVLSSTGAQLHNAKQTLKAGMAIFHNMSIDRVGSNYSIQFRFGDLVAISSPFNVRTGNATQIAFSSAVPTEWVVNSALPTFTVDLLDHGSFLVANDNDACPTISVAIKTGPSMQLAGTTTASVTAGKADFAGVSIPISGMYAFRFTCGSAGKISAPLDTGSIILHSYGQPVLIQIVTEPGRPIANFDGVNPADRKSYRLGAYPKLRLIDAHGNLVHGFQGHFKADLKHGSFSAAVLGGDAAITLPATWGMVEFDNLIIRADSASMQNASVILQFASTCCSLFSSSALVETQKIVLNPAPTQMLVATPSTVEAGEAFLASIKMQTASAVDIYTYLGTAAITLHNSSDDSASNAMSGVHLVKGVDGQVSFPGLVISTPGTYIIRAYATRPHLYLNMVLQDSAVFSVSVGPARGLSFLNHTSGCKGGVLCTVQPKFQIVDASGNAVTVAGITLRAAAIVSPSASGGGCCTESKKDCPVHNIICPILGGTKVATSDASGQVTFADVVLSTAGTVHLNFSGVGSSILETLHVSVGPAARTKILLPPVGLVAGSAFERQPIVIASDFGGNWISTAAGTITAKFTLLGCSSGDLGCESFGTLTAGTAAGISRFTDLGTKYAGQMRLEFRLEPLLYCGVLSCWSSTQVMQVTPGIPSQLVVVSATTEYFCSGNMTPPWSLDIRDKSGNRVISGGPYTLSVTSTPAHQVAGMTTVGSNAGQATFSNINIMKSCYFYAYEPFELCYTLTFRLGDITVTSNPFTVMSGPATDMEFHSQPEGTSVGAPPGYPSVRLVDVSGNPVIPLPTSPHITASCGIANMPSATGDSVAFDGVNLLPDMVRPTLSYEKTDALAVLLGQDESYNSKTSVVFSGLNINWRVPQCFFPTTCPKTVDDFRTFRIRMVARFGSLVADSHPLSVDVAHPVDFNVYQTNLSAIVLRWNSPFFGPSPMSYRLRYRSLNTPGAEWVTLTDLRSNIYTFGNLDRYELMEFEICSKSLFGESCSPKGPAAITAAPVQAVTFAEVAYATEESIFVSWRAPNYGVPPPAYQITIQEMPDGWETVLLNDVVGLNVSIPDVSPNKTYIFGVYSKAAGGDYYTPRGAKTQPILPTAATSSVQVSCPTNALTNLEECMGTGLVMAWAAPVGVLYQPRNFKVRTEQYFDNMTIALSLEQHVPKSQDMKATITGLTRGRLTRLRLLSQSVVDFSLYTPSVNFFVTPTAAPSPPVGLTLNMRANRNVVGSWKLPLDSGDGTQLGTAMNGYVIMTSVTDRNEWKTVRNPGQYNLTREFAGLALNKSHTFRVSAENQFLFASKCTIECNDLKPLMLIGTYIESHFFLGQIPYWDSMHAPVKQDPPPLFNLFVGSLFTFSLKALSTGAGEQIKISGTGLGDCGAKLTSVVVGNPATATLTLLPAIQHLDKNFWICFIASDHRGAFSDERCLQAYVVRPNPTFLAPIDLAITDPEVRASYSAVVGCLLEFDVKAHDLTSGKSVSAASASALGYKCFLKEHRTTIYSKYETRTIEGLPEHAVLQEGVVKYANPSTRTFSWRPARGQETFSYNVCFTVEDELGTSNTASPAFDGAFCVHIGIKRCRMCLLPGDSLFSVAQTYKTEWLNLWSGNEALLRPSEAPATAEVLLGPLYKALPHDSINSIASRMSIDPALLLSWNPDLSSAFGDNTGVVIDVEQDICVLPQTCTQ